MDWIGILSYWISFGLYVVIISILGFFAGYILFFGTMFRAYGLLKVFFILLFTVSLWPLLWHSINFAVYTIAVSDNAMANNVIIGGASLAKVFIPLWLISKTSKIPFAETLKKISFTGGSLAYAGGSYTYSTLNNNNISQDVQNEEETINEGAEISISEENYSENKNYTDEQLEDFSIRKQEDEMANFDETALLSENNIPQENSLDFSQEDSQSVEISSQSHIEQNISGESFNENKQDIHVENSPQITKEITEHQNISQSHNESILNEAPSHKIENEKSITEHNPKMFDEDIQDWEEGENYIAPRHHKNKDGDKEL